MTSGRDIICSFSFFLSIFILFYYKLTFARSQLFSKAARQGLPEAQYNLGTLFYEGIGTQKNMKQALKCFKLAAQV